MRLLGGIPLFSACTKRELSRIASLVDELEVPKGKVLTRQGDPGSECFVIASGRARASIRGRKSVPLSAGSCFGEMALLDEGPRSATVTAITDMYVLVLDSRSFSMLLDDVPIVGRRVMRGLAERLRDAQHADPAL